MTDEVPPVTTSSTIRGGVSVAGDQIAIGGDVVGRDKIVQGYTAAEVRALLDQLATTFQPRPFDGRCPYLGLATYDEDSADLFFGRERLVAELVDRVREARWVFVTGPSGSGKSSLVRAGLLHSLKHAALPDSDRWLYEALRPGREPLTELARVASSLAGTLNAGEDIRTTGRTDHTILHQWAEVALKDKRERRAVILVDQFEETFTQVAKEAERTAFLDLLTYAATVEGGRVTLVFAMRSDFVSNCAAYPRLNDLLNQQFMQIGVMTPAELVSAIAQPAMRVGLKVEPELVAQIIADMKSEPGALPLVQFALRDLFDAQQAKGGVSALTLRGYLERGGIHQALERHADSTLAQLSEPEQAMAREVFSGLIQVGRGAEDTRRTALFDELVPADTAPAQVEAVIGKLADARLIITDERDGRDIVTIAHEKLIEAWPWLRKLVNENRDAIALQNQIAEDAVEWERNQRDASYLYGGARLANAREQLTAKKIVLNGLAQAFVNAGVEAEEANRAREAARIQKELADARKLAESEKQRAEEQTRSAVRLRQRALYLIGVLGVAVVLGIAASVFGIQSNQNAESARRSAATAEAASTQSASEANSRATAEANALIQRDAAQRQQQLSRSRELAAVALNQLTADPERGILIALEAISVTHTFEAEDVLRQALQASRLRQVLHSTADVVDAEFSPDGTQVVTLDQAGGVRVWNVATGQLAVERSAGAANGRRVQFSADGRWLLTLVDGRVQLWAVADFKLAATLQQEEDFDDAWWSVDGTRVLTLGAGRARLWRTGDDRPLATLNTVPARLARFSPDGQRIAVATEDRRVFVWAADTGEPVGEFPVAGDVFDLRWLPDHQQLLVYGFFEEGAITLQRLDANTGETQLIYNNDQPGGISWRVDLTPDGQLVAVTGGTPVVWAVSSGQIRARLRGQTTEVQQLAFSADGQRLATAGYDGEVRIWEAQTGRELLVLKGQAQSETRMQFAPDGRQLLTISRDGTAHVLDVTTAGQLPTQFFAYGGFSWAMLSPDARWLVTAISAPNETAMRAWDVASGRVIKTLDAFWGYARFSSDSRWLVGNGDLEQDIIRDTANWQSVPLPQRPLSVSPDGTLAALGPGLSNRIRIWDVAAQAVVIGLPITPTNPVFAPDNAYLAAAAAEQVGVWDIASGRQVAQLAARVDASDPTSLIFSPDSERLLTRDLSGTLRLWPISGGSPIAFEGLAQDNAWQVAFSPDSRQLLTFEQTSTEAQVWQTADGKLLARLRGAEGVIASAQFSPDSRTIVTVHDGITARLWEAATGEQRAILRGHAASGVVVQYSPDGREVVTADPAGTIFRHKVALDDLMALARERVARALSCEERVQYLREEAVCLTP